MRRLTPACVCLLLVLAAPAAAHRPAMCDFATPADAAGSGGLFGSQRDYVGTTKGKPTPPPVGDVRQQVAVYVHVITKSDGVTLDVSQQRIDAQIAHLNGAFGDEATFTLAGVDRTANDAWFDMTYGSAEEQAAKNALRKGSADDLNLYTTGGADNLAWGTFPWTYANNPKRDGIVVPERYITSFSTLSLLETATGAQPQVTREGDIAVHEVGHWLGLFHTFQGGCTKQNDQVADTPAQKDATRGCPADGTDTCRLAGDDPIHNFMDYSNEACVREFTTGQHDRTDSMWVQYRDGR